MSDYVYRNPLDNGYKQFKLTKQQHNKLFKYRQIKWCDKYEYYYKDNRILIHKFGNWKLIILQTVLFPFNVLYAGFSNFKELIDEYKSMYNQKKYGSFVADSVGKSSKIYDEIMEIIQK